MDYKSIRNSKDLEKVSVGDFISSIGRASCFGILLHIGECFFHVLAVKGIYFEINRICAFHLSSENMLSLAFSQKAVESLEYRERVFEKIVDTFDLDHKTVSENFDKLIKEAQRLRF